MDAITRLQAFLRLTESVRRAQSVPEVYGAAIDCVEACFGVKRASLLLFDPDGAMRFKAWRGISEAYRTCVEGHTPWTPATPRPEPIVISDVFADPELAAYHEGFRKENIRGLMFVPLTGNGLVIGKFMLYHAEPVHYSAAELREALAVADQISIALDRRRGEEQVRELNVLLRGLVEILPVGVCYVDGSNILRYANTALCKILSLASAEPFLGQDVEQMRAVIAPLFRDPDEFLRATQEQHDRAVPVHSMEALLCDGRLLERRYFPVHSGGELVGHLGMMEDITERRQLQTQALHSQKMESIGHLAGGIAHDFNNLLMAITGQLELALADVAKDSSAHASMSHALEASSQAATLTRQLLAFARRQPVRPVTIDLHALLRRVQPMLRCLIREDIVMHQECVCEAAWVRADEGQLEQVLVNLVLNARDAMPNGGDLWLSSEQQPSDGGGHVGVLTVRDTGVGMDGETRARIFEPFYTTKELGRGTGLGLATVYGIVEQAGGRIEVTSALGSGTVFRAEFPCVPEPTRIRPASSFGVPAPGGNETVLLVEDDDMVRLLAETMLRRFGYQVHAMGSAEAALAWLVAYPGELHLLLSDIVMPGMNGRELAQRVQGERPSVRILLMSGYAPAVDGEGVVNARDFLAKPFSSETLARRVREVLTVSARSVDPLS